MWWDGMPRNYCIFICRKDSTPYFLKFSLRVTVSRPPPPRHKGKQCAIRKTWTVWFKLVFLLSSDKYSRVKILDHIVALFFIFEVLPHCFPWWLHQFTLLPEVHDCWWSVCLLWKMYIQVLGPYFNQIIWGFFMLSYMSSLYIVNIISYQTRHLQIFSPIQ